MPSLVDIARRLVNLSIRYRAFSWRRGVVAEAAPKMLIARDLLEPAAGQADIRAPWTMKQRGGEVVSAADMATAVGHSTLTTG